MFSSNTTQTSGGYEIQRSLRFNSADSAYLNRTPASAGNRKTWTWSGWVKKSVNALADYQYLLSSRTLSTDNSSISFYPNTDAFRFGGANSGNTIELLTTAVYRDVSAWYHLVVAMDTTQATASDRLKMYVNGVQVTAFSTATYPVQNAELSINSTTSQQIGSYNGSATFNGYMTEVNFIDGQALTPSSFGDFNADTGVWQPKRYGGSYGANGFYLNFSDNSNTTAATLGKDYSGNGNNWTPNNFSVSAGAGNDSLVDSPTSYGTDTGVGGSVRGNYCTWNPLDSALTLLNGNLQVGAPTDWRSVRATFGITSGKWYWEVNPGSALVMIGISRATASQTSYVGNDANGWSYYGNTGTKYNSGTPTSYGAAYSSSDVIGVAFDADAGTLVFYKNNTSQGTAFSGLTSGPYFPALGVDNGVANTYINFGQRPFAYTAPSGFKALNTQNLPTPTIGATPATQAGKFFNPVTYTGTGSALSITGVGFQPDWVWTKERGSPYNHGLFDSVRGATKGLVSNTTSAEYTDSQSLTSFNSDGFSLGTAAGENISGETYVAWNWKANGAGVTNTAGSITSTVSANTTSGFSVVTYTGSGSAATVGHGLGAAPRMIIVKARNFARNWNVYHGSLGATQGLNLNATGAATTDSGWWNNTAPTSSVFTAGAYSSEGTVTYVAYCFAEVPGYSKFGSYTGNGSTDGVFVFCGFRPAYLMVKRSDQAYDWWVFDGKRPGYNVTSNRLAPNLSDAEYTSGTIVDFTANGFKIRDASQGWNGSGGTIVFAAFAEAPQKFALAR
jgi:hypothetical protein